MTKWMPEEGKLFRELYKEYSVIHDGNDVDWISKTLWGYSNYSSGEKVEDCVRRAYRGNWDVMFMYEDPFTRSNAEYRTLLHISEDGSVKAPSKTAILFRKAKVVLKEEGLKAFFRAFFKWLKYTVKK